MAIAAPPDPTTADGPVVFYVVTNCRLSASLPESLVRLGSCARRGRIDDPPEG
jgi:hypothetical protein